MQWIDLNNLRKLEMLNSFGSMPTDLAAGYLNCHHSTLSRYSNLLLREFNEYLLWQKRDKTYSGRTLQLITLYRAINARVNQQKTFEILWELLQQHNYNIAELCDRPEQIDDLIEDIYSPTKTKIPC